MGCRFIIWDWYPHRESEDTVVALQWDYVPLFGDDPGVSLVEDGFVACFIQLVDAHQASSHFGILEQDANLQSSLRLEVDRSLRGSESPNRSPPHSGAPPWTGLRVSS